MNRLFGYMSRVLKIAFGLGAIGASLIVTYSIRVQLFASEPRHEIDNYKPQKGVSASPSHATALAGVYYMGDGTGRNIYLTLKPDGQYTAEWQGCLGSYGEAIGHWQMTNVEIVFIPTREVGIMKGNLGTLDIVKFRGQWIFIGANKHDHDSYNTFGVSALSCFQNTNSIFRGS